VRKREETVVTPHLGAGENCIYDFLAVVPTGSVFPYSLCILITRRHAKLHWMCLKVFLNTYCKALQIIQLIAGYISLYVVFLWF
jgi:hypothetical protein